MLDTQIVSCDSMQVYKQMDIGTAKPTKQEMEGITHHMIDVVYPNEDFNVLKYTKMTKDILNNIISKNMIPIIVGGTGLYVEALIHNLQFSEGKIDNEYREELLTISKNEGNEKLYEMLKQVDMEYANKIHINDTKRIIRGLEVYKNTGHTMTYYNSISKQKESEYDFYLFGINMEREKLYEKINKRVDIMLAQGLVEEVKNIYNQYNEFPTAMQGLGYKEVVEYLKNECTYEQMVEKIKIETRHYAKRQLTWFRRYEQMQWLDSNQMDTQQMAEYIKNCLTNKE